MAFSLDAPAGVGLWIRYDADVSDGTFDPEWTLLPTAGADADPSVTLQQIADMYVAWRELVFDRRLASEPWKAREEAREYNEKLVELSLELIERRKRGEIPDQRRNLPGRDK